MTVPIYIYKTARHLTRAKDSLLRHDDAALEEAISACTSALAALFDEKNRRNQTEMRGDAIERILAGEGDGP
jgi:hypothetical protein